MGTENTDLGARLHPSPLDAIHSSLGAHFTDFAGWKLPIRYSSDLQEHRAVREHAGLFDISHMAEIWVAGPRAGEFLDYALAGRFSNLEEGQARYSLLLNPQGGVIDDVIVYHTSEKKYLLVANAANRQRVLRELQERVAAFKDGVERLEDVTENIALLALQGPSALRLLENTPELEASNLGELRYYRCQHGTFRGEKILLARTGYTGEDGFEIYVPAQLAAALWEALAQERQPHLNILPPVPCGLACRNSLRLEAGMPLYGQELDEQTLPEQAGLGRVVALKKPNDFVGRQAVEAGPAAGAHKLVGLVAEGRRAAREGYPVLAPAGDDTSQRQIGRITSGIFSPTLQVPVAMAYVEPKYAEEGSILPVDIRGSRVEYRVVALPFYKRNQ